MMKKKFQKRTLYFLDLFIVVGSLVVLLSTIGYVQPRVIGPLEDSLTNTSVLFSFTQEATLFIDDNPQFTSPEEISVRDKRIVHLNPGRYYWKVKGLHENVVHTLNIQSVVDLQLLHSHNEYNVVNAGNMPLDVAVYQNTTLVQKLVLNTGQNTTSSGELFTGRQHDS